MRLNHIICRVAMSSKVHDGVASLQQVHNPVKLPHIMLHKRESFVLCYSSNLDVVDSDSERGCVDTDHGVSLVEGADDDAPPDRAVTARNCYLHVG